MSTPRYLSVEDDGIADAGLRQLEKLAKLKKVNLELTNVSEEGVKQLERAPPGSEILH